MPQKHTAMNKKSRKVIITKQPVLSYQHKKVTLSESIESKKFIRMLLTDSMKDDLKYICTVCGFIQPTKLIAALLKKTHRDLKKGGIKIDTVIPKKEVRKDKRQLKLIEDIDNLTK